MSFDKSEHLAEIEYMQQILKLQFQKNIVFFQSKSPEIAEKFAKFEPESILLKLSEEGYLNLYNKTLNNKPVYSYDPQQFCQDYINKYINAPHFHSIRAKIANVLDAENILHIASINKCNQLMENLVPRTKTSGLEHTCNFMLLNGIGLGYIIPQLLEHTDIKNLVIIEPHSDIFHAALYILDWQQLYEQFDKPHHSLKIIIGQNTNDSINTLRKHLNRIGMHNAVNPFKIDHLSSKEMKEITDTFFERLGILFSSSGYFDDEQVGLAHTIQNWNKKVPPLREHSQLNKKKQNKPVFIIGNGPSLDAAKEFLQKNQNEAFYISCGTTIGSLKKMGIKPDFHIEMERTKPVIEWLNQSTDEEYRRNIILLALNTVHPEVFELFPTKGMGLKSNDLGTHFFSQYIPNDQFCINLAFCNPTVGNAGLAFAVAMGFKEVYLFGLDLGFSSGEQHHSTYSTHYRVEDKHTKSLNLYQRDDQGNKTVPANFGGTVLTTPVYLSAKLAIEGCLQQAGNVKCYNTSDGILIGNTTPQQLNKIVLGSTSIIDKQEVCQTIFTEYFYSDGLTKIHSPKKIKQYFEVAITKINILKKLFVHQQTDWDTAQNLLSDQHDIILSLAFNKKTEYIYTLLKGSIYTFNVCFNKALHLGETREVSLDTYNQIREIYLDFLDKVIIKIKKDLLTIDEKTRNLNKKINQ